MMMVVVSSLMRIRLCSGILKMMKKYPVSSEFIETAITRTKEKVQAMDRRELLSPLNQ